MRHHIRLLVALTALLFTHMVHGQKLDPITWDVSVEANGTDEATVKLAAKIDAGWHLYGFNLPDDGPNSTQISFDLPAGVEAVGSLTPSRQPIEQFDPVFSLNLSWWEDNVSFTQKFKISDQKTHDISGSIYFQGCNDQACIAPQRIPFDVKIGTGPAVAPVVEETVEVEEQAPVAAPAVTPVSEEGWWAPVEITADEQSQGNIADSSLWIIFLWGFGGGLIALLTPCVWPMIPMLSLIHI